MGEAFIYGRSGGGINATLPPQIRNFLALGGAQQVSLSWQLPADTTYYAGLVIIRKAGSAPESVRDGAKITLGNAATSYTDTGLTDGVAYYYRAYPHNAKKQYQTDLTGAVTNAQAGIIPLSVLPIMAVVRIPEDDVPQDFYVVRHNAYTNGRTLLLRRYIHSEREWHSSNVNAYATCTLDAWFNGDYFNSLPADIRGQIAAVQIDYTPGNGYWTVTKLSRKVFAVSGTELGQSHADMKVEGTTLANAATLKIATDSGGTAKAQWTRSPYTEDFKNAWSASTDGSFHSSSSRFSSLGARPAFTLPANCAINPVPNPDGSYNLAYA